MFITKFSTLILALSAFGTASTVMAQGRSSDLSYRSSSGGEGQHTISGAFGFLAPGANELNGTATNGSSQNVAFRLSGLLGLGGDYDYMKTADVSFGGLLRYYNTSSTYGNVTYKNTMVAIGPDVKGYLSNATWIGYLGAGLIYMSPSYSANGNTVSISAGLGLMTSLGLLYKITDTVSAGVETLRMIGLSSNINGVPIEDFMLKARFAL